MFAILLWLVKMSVCMWITWRLILTIDLLNPLLAILVAITFMMAGPPLLAMLVEAHSQKLAAWGMLDPITSADFVAPLIFASFGVMLCAGIETVMRR